VRIPVHIVGGFLGVGKTTTLSALVASRAGQERAAIVVNDFGDAAIDAARLDSESVGAGAERVMNIPGGCVCCTAPEGLVRVVSELLDVTRPDRIYIEPSGLGRPRDVVDMLVRGGLASRVDLRPVIILVDPEKFDAADPLMHEQWEGGDVLVVNRIDRASPSALSRIRAAVREKWPPFLRVIETSHGVLPAEVPDWTRTEQAHDHGHEHGHGHGHGHDHGHGHGHEVDSTVNFQSASRIVDPTTVFDWRTLNSVLQSQEIVRFKGMFHSDIGWIRVDRAGAVVEQRGTPWRRDSRFDLIVAATSDIHSIVSQLEAASLPPEAVDPEGFELVDADANRMELFRSSLLRLGALDVAARVPGRLGTAVLLKDVVALLSAPPDARVVLSAADGMITDAIRVDALGDALLVYALDGQPLPTAQGGPFRVLVPAGGSCANVKSLTRIRIL
jgi:G3E family GTPase